MGGDPVQGGPGHTASCILGCSFAWVTDGGGVEVVDLRVPDQPVDLGTFETPAGRGIATHDVQVDGDGHPWVVGFGGAAAYRLPKGYAGAGLGELLLTTDQDGQSTYLTELGVGDGSKPNDYILHNSLRRAGSDVLYVSEEDYTRPGCRGAGRSRPGPSTRPGASASAPRSRTSSTPGRPSCSPTRPRSPPCARRTTSTSGTASSPRAGTSRAPGSSTCRTRPTSARSATSSHPPAPLTRGGPPRNIAVP